MNNSFIDFWHLYMPAREYHNRYLACERLWQTMDDRNRLLIMRELEKENKERSPPPMHTKNPYFYLIDWRPPRPQWLSPVEVGRLLQQGVALAVCRNPETDMFGTLTCAEAQALGLEVHHVM